MGTKSRATGRHLRFETLETRQLLAAVATTPPLVFDNHVDYAIPVLQSPPQSQSSEITSQNQLAIAAQFDAAHHHANPNELDRIVLHDGSFIPRRALSSDNSLIVPPGETFTLAADSDYDFIEVHGTLRVSRNFDTTLRFVDLIVFPGGELDMGTESDPVLRNVEFIVKDVSIDTEQDPWQLGNGIINFGTWNAFGRKLDHTWTSLATELQAGDTKIVLTEQPVGWQVGDELLIPDTAQIADTVRRESSVRIAAIDGSTITLDKPLDIAHLAVRDPAGNVRVMPYVANATRNIVIRSENPEGTRGHTIQLEESVADVRYVSFLGLGRTLAKPLDNAVVVDGVVTPGTNQVARYAWHWHHIHPSHEAPQEHPHQGHLVGSFFDGTDIGKWGIVIHGSSDMHVADNVTDRFVGAGIVTEDGNEYRNVIERNFATGSFGFGTNDNSKSAMKKGIPGGEGAGFWFHSSENYIRDNVAINNNIGYAIFNFLHPSGVTPGRIPLDFARNVALSNLRHGIEAWRTPLEFVVREAILANNGQTQFFFGTGELASITLRDTLILAQGGVTTGVHSHDGYGSSLEIFDSEILGCKVGTMALKHHLEMSGTILQNRLNFDWSTAQNRDIPMIVLEDVVSIGLPGLPFQHFETGQSNPSKGSFSYNKNVGYRVLLRNWQLSGKNYIYYRPQALPSNPAGITVPERGLTLRQAWDKYSMSVDGGPVPDDAVPLANSDGYVLEYSGEVPLLDLPASKWILVYPNASTAYPVSSRKLTMIYTGAPADINRQIEIDGQLLTLTTQQLRSRSPSQFQLPKNGNWNEPGWHTMKTWRTLNGQLVDGSTMEFSYYVGDESV